MRRISRKPRHYLPLVVGIPTVVFGLISVLELWGGVPAWKPHMTLTGALATTLLGLMNVNLDKKEKENEEEEAK